MYNSIVTLIWKTYLIIPSLYMPFQNSFWMNTENVININQRYMEERCIGRALDYIDGKYNNKEATFIQI